MVDRKYTETLPGPFPDFSGEGTGDEANFSAGQLDINGHTTIRIYELCSETIFGNLGVTKNGNFAQQVLPVFGNLYPLPGFLSNSGNP